jgi:hypothetical protein
MRSTAERDVVARLAAEGLNNCQIERETGIPRRTISDWRNGRGGDGPAARAVSTCAVCAGTPERLPPTSYAYLLGAYLGDGHIVELARGVHRLTIYCSLIHINVAWWITRATEDVIGRRVTMRPDPVENVLYVQSYWKHWPCLFPQHGPGRKHNRRIALAPWQQRIVDAHPDQLVRGLIHSDGWRGINRIRHPKRTYEYVRYGFTNRSGDIRRIFCDACDSLRVDWRVMKADTISIAKRDSVARFDEFVGPKR